MIQLLCFAGHLQARLYLTRHGPVLKSHSYDAGLATNDLTKPSGRSMLTTVSTLQAAGIEPLVVQWVRIKSCSSSSPGPVFDLGVERSRPIFRRTPAAHSLS